MALFLPKTATVDPKCFVLTKKMFGRLLITFVFLAYGVMAIPEILSECYSKNNVDKFFNCAIMKVLKTVERAENQKSFELMPGLLLERNDSAPRMAKELKVDLPKDIDNQTSKIFDLLLEVTGRFISGRTLKFELPLNYSKNVARSLEEGRGKMKKMMNLMGPLFLGLGAKMMSMVPIMFGGVFLMAAKALVIGKVALAIAALLFIQIFFSGRFFSSGGGTYGIPPTYGVPTTFGTSYGYGTNSIGGGAGGGWGTSAQYPYQ